MRQSRAFFAKRISFRLSANCGQDAVNADGYNLPFLRRLLCRRLRSGTGTRTKLHRNFIPSFLRRRRDWNRIFLVVLADCATKFGIQSHAGSFSASARWFVCAAITGSKMLSRFPLVAGPAFIMIVGYGNRHRWYQLPLAPIAAAFASAACALVDSKNPSRVIAATLSILLVSSFVILAVCYVRPFYQFSRRNFAMRV